MHNTLCEQEKKQQHYVQPSIVATNEEQNFDLYRGVALSQGLICIKIVH